MKAFFLSILLGFSSWALDSSSFDHSGVYEVVNLQACASNGLKAVCVAAKDSEYQGRIIDIVQSGDHKSLSLCTSRNFNNGIFSQTNHCYVKNRDRRMVLTASGGGFNGHIVEKEITTTYSRFRRTGKNFELVEGVSSIGYDLYYVYSLVKTN